MEVNTSNNFSPESPVLLDGSKKRKWKMRALRKTEDCEVSKSRSVWRTLTTKEASQTLNRFNLAETFSLYTVPAINKGGFDFGLCEARVEGDKFYLRLRDLETDAILAEKTFSTKNRHVGNFNLIVVKIITLDSIELHADIETGGWGPTEEKEIEHFIVMDLEDQ